MRSSNGQRSRPLHRVLNDERDVASVSRAFAEHAGSRASDEGLSYPSRCRKDRRGNSLENELVAWVEEDGERPLHDPDGGLGLDPRPARSSADSRFATRTDREEGDIIAQASQNALAFFRGRAIQAIGD